MSNLTWVGSTETFKKVMAQCKKVDIVLSIQEMSEKLCIVTIVSYLFTLKAIDLEGLFWSSLYNFSAIDMLELLYYYRYSAHLRFLMTCKYTSTWISDKSLAISRTIPLWFWSKISYNRKSHLCKETLPVLASQHTDALGSL